MKILSDFSLDELYDELKSFPRFRAKQVFDAIVQAKDYELVAIPAQIKNELQKDYILLPVKIFKVLVSTDGTKKYLFKTHDNNLFEAVFLRQNYGNTICMSTQIGCRMGCKFCASTQNGLIRHLSAGEMFSAIACINADNGKCTERNFTNIVLMGSGEPFDNYDEVVKWLDLITSKNSFNISERNISISTCGLVEKIYDFAKLNKQITLCVSLHATTDETRRTIMPIANKYTIAEIVDALKFYVEKTTRRVVFEYCLIKDVNNLDEDVIRLRKLTAGLLCHVNVICLNPNGGTLKATTRREAVEFVKKLNDAGISATLRHSQGEDIAGACGMLRAKTLSEERPN